MNVNTNNVVVTQTQKPRTLGSWLAENKNYFEIALPKGTINIDRFIQAASLTIADPKQPLLAQCTKDSIFRALRESASLGLEVGGVLGQAYLIPYNESVKQQDGSWQKNMTCRFQIGYKGLIALARRSNTIKTIACETIFENDIFEVQLGCNRSINHKIDISKPRGKAIGYYCLVELVNGGIQFDVKSVDDIKIHRDKYAKSYKADDPNNIWNKNFDAMAKKTCAIQALKLCPISIEALEAIRRDELNDIKDEEETTSTTSVSIAMNENVMDAEFRVSQPENIEQSSSVVKSSVNPSTTNIADIATQAMQTEQEVQNNNQFNNQAINQSLNQSKATEVINDYEGAQKAFDDIF